MDVLFFLRDRLKFLRAFYEDASQHFRERQRRITEGEEPYDQAPDGFDPEWGEPAYMDEWSQADESIDFLGQAAVSSLAASLILYLDECREQLSRRYKVPELDDGYARKNGALKAYEKWFSDIGVDIHVSGVDFAIIEQVVLTRNSVQHPSSIGFKTIQPGKKQRSKYPIPFFAHPFEERMAEAYTQEGADVAWSHRMLQVTPEKLFHAIDEVEKLCTWDVEVFPWSSAKEKPE